MTGPMLVLVRHGQTDSNVIKALDSRPPGPPLNTEGRAQAESTAGVLAAEPITAVYASTAVRAQQTAAPIAARHGLDVAVVEGVHEVFCGDLEGRSDPAARDAFDDVYASWVDGELDRHLPGGESARQLRERFLPVVARLWRRHAGMIVVVSHGAAIRLAAGALIGENADTRYVPNAGRVMLAPVPGSAPGEGGWLLKFWEEGEPSPGDATGGADD
ncbi:histidine phosphatase family protein [Pseudonocardia acaciae]|uniref:histidine phosphatase family protein n=1 Tax=Pseudonocardia acaciae TaxID=551276 RepID=UPI001FE1F709|nr:histidine phosphatase family protein [Pseudonocardia acaciae]